MPRSGPGPLTSSPYTRTLPPSALMKPPTICRNVLLPQPLGPITVMNSPSRTMNCSTLRTSSVWPFLV